MFKYKKDNNNDNISCENIISELSKNYNYIEHILDGRIVLEHRRVKFVEIKDTKEDREKYILIMKHYIEYIKEYYYRESKSNEVDLNKWFDNEIIKNSNNKMPMFFVYNNKNVLLGMCGFRQTIKINIDNKSVKFNELSIRLTEKSINKISYGYGAICYFIMSLYAIKRNNRYYFKSFIFLRDLLFRSVNSFTYIKYLKQYSYQPNFLDISCDFDVFFDHQTKLNELKLASFNGF